MENNTINVTGSGMAMEAENIEIKADLFAGRDQFFEEHYYYTGTAEGFSVINLEPYNEQHYIMPLFTIRLEELLRSTHLLLLTGSYGFDKSAFTRHLAYRLSCVFPGITAKEYDGASDNNIDLYKILMDEDTPHIYILNRVSAKDIGFDMERLKRAAEQKSHFVLLSSDIDISAWKLPAHVLKKYWFEIPDHDLYSQQVIEELLVSEFNKHHHQLIFETTFDALNANTHLTSKHTVHSLAAKLRTPEQVVFFTEMLVADVEPVTAKRLEDLLNSFGDTNEPMISKWFRTLSSREKVLALGACLFEGLFEEQFFELMKMVTEEFWSFKNPELKALDYEDLEFMMNFFKFEPHDDSVSKFKGKFPNQRTDIIKTVWHSHRRHLMAALPVLIEAGSNTKSRKHLYNDLYSSRERRIALRFLIAELLSDIGMISIDLVEQSLIELASAGDETLQRVTAKAMSRWRTYGKEELLFDVLQRWHQQGKTRNRANDLFVDDSPAPLQQLINIKNTVLLTLSYASEYDEANQLNENIILLLVQTAQEENAAIHARFSRITREMIVKHHVQLKNILPDDLMIYPHLEHPISAAILEAYEQNPFLIKALIEDWISDCFSDHSKDNRRKKVTYRDQTLITLLKIYQGIPYQTIDAIKPEEVWVLAQQLYKAEQRPAVKDALFKTIGVLISLDPEYALDQLEQLFTYSSLNERELLLSSLVNVYIDQRRNLEGAIYKVRVRNEWFPSFINQARPLTAIEKSMYNWLNSDRPFAQQIALLVFLQFAKEYDTIEATATPEPIFATNRSSSASSYSENAGEATGVNFPPYIYEPSLTWWNRILIWWWLLFETPENKEVFKTLFKTMLQHHSWFTYSHIIYVIDKMNRRQEDKLNRVGKWMERWFKRIIIR